MTEATKGDITFFMALLAIVAFLVFPVIVGPPLIIIGLLAGARIGWNRYQEDCFRRRVRLRPYADNDEYKAFYDREEARYKRRRII
jgi:hypothetical protein